MTEGRWVPSAYAHGVVQLNYAIDDELHHRAKVAAAEQGVTLKAFVEDALRRAVESHGQGAGSQSGR